MSARQTAWGAYSRIADELRAQLAAGTPPPGKLMPSEAALSEQYGVVRNTVRRALAQLESEGWIETLPGRGRVVRQPGEPPSETTLPQYKQIAAKLRTAIEQGDLAPGDALPSEAALVEQYNVSRGTARQALADLEGAGLVESIHGKGRYVRKPGTSPDR